MKLKIFALALALAFVALLAAPSINYAQDKQYTVIKGDCLWKISKKELNNGKLWPEIWVLNKDGVVNKDKMDKEKYKTIKNPNFIFPGQILKVPKAPKLTDKELKDAYKTAKKMWRKSHPMKPKVKAEDNKDVKKDVKKEEPKKDAKKDVKKEEPKKEVKKEEPKKDAKK